MADRDPVVTPPTAMALAALVQFEAELRRKSGVPELLYHVANDSRRVLEHDQLFVLGTRLIGERMKILAYPGLLPWMRRPR
jgi:hypothetical protein